MNRSLRFNFCRVFDGIIWHTQTVEQHHLLLLEIRNAEHKQVSFSALDFQKNEFIWEDKTLEEPWWVSLSAVAEGIILYTFYTETNNPDRKALLAYSLRDHELLWWHNDLSLISVGAGCVLGFSSKLSKEVLVDLRSGKTLTENTFKDMPNLAGGGLIRPVQYTDAMDYFVTVQTFLQSRLNLSPVIALEYLEYESLIFISFNVTEKGLVNYLLVLSAAGDVLLHEKLDEPQKGIGLDTFFILNGCLFFVKNRRELVSYSIV